MIVNNLFRIRDLLELKPIAIVQRVLLIPNKTAQFGPHLKKQSNTASPEGSYGFNNTILSLAYDRS